LGGFSLIEEPNILFSIFVPIMVYSNADKDKAKILSDNKCKSGIYLWTHKESGKRYVGSAVDLPKRIRDYYSIAYLTRSKSMYICNALLHHGYSAFSLTIFEYIDIFSLSKDKAKTFILEREQLYLDSLSPEYNILATAGSRLGGSHSEEAKQKMSESHKGKLHSAKTKALMSIPKSEAHKRKISASNGTVIFVYDTQGSLVNTFCSAREAGRHFDCTFNTILKYAKNNELFQDEWILSTSVKE
jgi:group I intron endonuclease